ncbi:substrate-binding domain-containing protein [Tenacibaculum geojense]|uniref:histidine kinase n=1 Tax=Tenacibaculum geojense TaxID=915352 RepID=A0ABW3JSS9_9FLAO
MKKLFFNAFFLMLTVLLLSCTTNNKQKKYTIGFSQLTNNDDWRKAMNQSMEIEAGFYPEASLIIKNANANVDKQIADIEDFIDAEVDVIIVSPIAPKPLRGVLKKAAKANIPVIVLNRKIEDADYISFIGADDYEVGVNTAKYLIESGEEINVLEIKGWAGTTPTIQRSKGFNNTINNISSITPIGFVQDKFENPGVKNEIISFLKKHPEVNFVFAHSDDLAFQAYEAAKDLELASSLKIIGIGGVNAPKGGINLVKNNVLLASVLYPTGGKQAFKTAMDIVTGRKVAEHITLPSVVIDSNNVDLLQRQAGLINSQELDIKRQQSKIQEQIQLYSSQRNFLIATLFLLSLILGLLYVTFKSRNKVIEQKKLLVELIDQIATQKKEIEEIAEDLRVTNEVTNNFFTGVSHDFKTPLSLILSSSESLLAKKDKKKPFEFNLIYNNSRRLLRMINQLLDFRRVGSKKFRLKVSKTNIYNFVNNIFQDFVAESKKKNINFNLQSSTQETQLYIDRDLFDNVLFNLLSNAFKFTPEKGSILVDISENENSVTIKVKDSGIGIVANEKDKIFDQFFLGSNNKQSSSGIGLYLAKEYVKLHKGSILVNSELGKGAEFVITIPKGSSNFKPNEIVVSDAVKVSDTIVFDVSNFDEITVLQKSDDEKETLLIIEDNSDLRKFLKSKLSIQYNVYESDGIDAIDKAKEIVPDIIISDVNLPKENGFEICEALKKDVTTSHIPIIILTALSNDDAHLQGLQSGVDMFLTKPFNLSVLNQSLQSLLYNRKKLQKFYNDAIVNVTPVTNEQVIEKPKAKKNKRTRKNKSLDNEFIESLHSYVAKNIDDSSFTVEVLADTLGISRVQLYRKTKALLGISISDFINGIRLEKAVEMLVDDNLTIADIAYSTGFSSPNYFSTAFKNKYGKSPNQYKKDLE